jgi:hypothetical protein
VAVLSQARAGIECSNSMSWHIACSGPWVCVRQQGRHEAQALKNHKRTIEQLAQQGLD